MTTVRSSTLPQMQQYPRQTSLPEIPTTLSEAHDNASGHESPGPTANMVRVGEATLHAQHEDVIRNSYQCRRITVTRHLARSVDHTG
jgi:hypothetical protein